MNKKQFNEKYKDLGGIFKLAQMRERLETLESISMEFGISKGRVAQWMFELFGEPYDPRSARREMRIKIIQSLLGDKIVDADGVVKDFLSRANKSYLKEAKMRSQPKT